MSATSIEAQRIDELIAGGTISDDDILALRQSVFRDGVIDYGEAAMVFRLDRECPVKGESWRQFFVDSLTDYFVWRREPRGYVDDQAATFLIDSLIADGKVRGEGELELLVNIVHWATSVPVALKDYALEAVRDSIMQPDGAAYGQQRRPQVIDPVDVEILRKILYAGALDGGLTISRREADLLFDLNRATLNADNAPDWPDLFVKAIGSHLMFPRGAPAVPSVDETLRREAWLEERRGVGGFLAGIGKSFRTFDVSAGESWRSLDLFGRNARRERAAAETGRACEADARERVDEDEALWLAKRLGEDGAIDANERALLAFVRDNATAIHPALDAALAKLDG